MNNTTNDPAFGPMEFDYGWCKEEEITFFGKQIEVEVLAEAEIGQPISDLQRDCYKQFCADADKLSTAALEALKHYYIAHLPAIDLTVDDVTDLPEEDGLCYSDLIRMVEPKTLFFPQDDLYAVLCNCIWEPEHGLAIMISEEGISIGTQDEIL